MNISLMEGLFSDLSGTACDPRSLVDEANMWHSFVNERHG